MPNYRKLAFKIKPRQALQGALYVAGWAVCQAPTAVHAAESARITQILDGPHVFIQDRRAKVNQVAKRGQRIRTGRARAELRFNSGAVGRLGHNSTLTIGQCARLQHGSMLVNGSMSGCSYSAIAGVRGTTYVLEVDGRGASSLLVLEGQVTVARSTVPLPDENDTTRAPSTESLINAEDTPAAEPLAQLKQASSNQADGRLSAVSLSAGEKVTLSPAGYPSRVERLGQVEFSKLVTEDLMQNYEATLPGAEKIQQSYQAQFPDSPYPKVKACGASISDSVRVRYPEIYQLLRSNYC